MTSKTSYFEPALFLRGLKKTFPVWLAYVVLWVLFLPLSILNRAQWDPKAADIRELILSGAIASVITTAVLALALAWVLFRFLFRTTTAYDIAALPVRRESLFLTNLLCGLAIALGTHLLIALITYGASALIGLPNFGACLQLVAAAMLAFLGFFGAALHHRGQRRCHAAHLYRAELHGLCRGPDQHGAAQQLCLRPRQCL